ncbi:glycosyl hydrolase family 17 protein [Paucihalobacter sp.]|uniref:glycosyl hydrolase family 17 protein n=1 Tax=Paucihalobacter sp. TaxID=2850405 RepID=UPI002FE3ABED
MIHKLKFTFIGLLAILITACNNKTKQDSKTETLETKTSLTAKEILGNANYQAISFGAYREKSRDIQPTLDEIKDDLKILHAMGIRIVRTYNVQLPHASNVVKAISELKAEDENFEMYVMLGAWIDCKNAWTDQEPDHSVESEANAAEIERAAALASRYPDIIKVIAVGNEAMVRWAASYYVQPDVILKWVTHLQDLKAENKLPKDLWITSSDDFSTWGGGDASYHTEDLEKLYKAVDYVSLHTYPYHNTHYNPQFWGVPKNEQKLTDIEKIDNAMNRSLEFAQKQYDSVVSYMKSIGVNKPVHIGETGWATISDGYYGPKGSKATDEYKEAKFHQLMRDWTNSKGISCFYFEAFDEPWKDAQNPQGSENHFGIFTVEGKAKYALWNLVDEGVFEGLTRNGNEIIKTFDGDEAQLMETVLVPPTIEEINKRLKGK